LRGFAGIELTLAAVPDATTVLNFRHWLEQRDLDPGAVRGSRRDAAGARSVDAAKPAPEDRRHDRRCRPRDSGDQRRRAVDKEQRRRATRRCTRPRKAINGISGCPSTSSGAHIGVDVASGVVHSLVGTAANEAEINRTVTSPGTLRSSAASSRLCRQR